MKLSRHLSSHTRRDAWVEINLSALEANTLAILQFLPEPLKLMAVLKADAYGHGAPMVLPTLEASGVQMIGVAAMDEAIQIRESGSDIPILVLGGTPDWAMQYAKAHNVQLTIFSQHHLDGLERLFETEQHPTPVHIKVDTGMHRIGVPWQEAVGFIEHCQACPFIEVKGVFSHLAHTHNDTFTHEQIHRWQTVIEGLSTPLEYLHLANSDGTWHYPLEHANMVRMGLAFFGYHTHPQAAPVALQPTMGLKARIVHIYNLLPGEGVSYNQTYTNTSDSPQKIATLPLGYADGIPRGLSNHMDGLFQGKRVPQVGHITMDQLMINVTDLEGIDVGDVITLLGTSQDASITLSDWAKTLNTIEYELMCGLRIRLPRTYVR